MSRGKSTFGVPEGKELLVSVIGDEDTVTGFLLAGIGEVDARQNSNFLVVTNRTAQSEIEGAFRQFCSREDIAVVLINQHIANDIRHLINERAGDAENILPTVVEIPSKTHSYDPKQDSVMQRVRLLLGIRE